ncbi:hypothetical protein Dimus_008130 [Dionaea muscipula]
MNFAGYELAKKAMNRNEEARQQVIRLLDRSNTQRGPAFISELLGLIPNAHYYKRGTYDLKKVHRKKESWLVLLLLRIFVDSLFAVCMTVLFLLCDSVDSKIYEREGLHFYHCCPFQSKRARCFIFPSRCWI